MDMAMATFLCRPGGIFHMSGDNIDLRLITKASVLDVDVYAQDCSLSLPLSRHIISPY